MKIKLKDRKPYFKFTIKIKIRAENLLDAIYQIHSKLNKLTPEKLFKMFGKTKDKK